MRQRITVIQKVSQRRKDVVDFDNESFAAEPVFLSVVKSVLLFEKYSATN